MSKFNGIVSAASPEAAKAGAEILAEGGNAIDAAIAVSLTLGVTEPAGSGIGGQGTFIIQKPNDVSFVINGTSYSPANIPNSATLADLKYRRASTVPSNLMVLDYAHRIYGSGELQWKRLLRPAIHYAKNGYKLGEFRYKSLLRHRKSLKRDSTASSILLNRDASAPEIGTKMKNTQLATTLERIADYGADDFYLGEIASEIAKDMSDNDGWITARDLKEVRSPRILPALKGTYKGWDVATLPPPASGWAVLMALNILEQAPSGVMSSNSSRRISWLIQALKVIHKHRMTRPIQDLVAYEDLVSQKIDKNRAERIAGVLKQDGTGETTHFSIVDKDGMAVGVTQSLNSYFGSKIAHPSLGFFYNDYMIEFVSASRDNPFSLRPRAMPYSSMSASIVSRNSKPVLVLGSPANERIISSVIQVISHWIDINKGIKEAVNAPRYHTVSEEEVMMEVKPDETVLLALEELGFSLYSPLSSLFSGTLNPYFGGVHAVALEDGVWCGAADPRRDGAVEHVEI